MRARLDDGWDVTVSCVAGSYWWNCWHERTAVELSGRSETEQGAWRLVDEAISGEWRTSPLRVVR